MKKKSVLYSVLSVSILGLIAKITGLFREGVIAAYFGTSMEMDIFSLISSNVTTIVTILASSLGVSLIPLYIRNETTNGIQYASKEFSKILNQYLVVTFLFFITIILLSPWIATMITRSKPEYEYSTILSYIRMMSFVIITLGASHLMVSVLNALRLFGWMQITQCFYSFLAIVFVMLWSDKIGVAVLILAYIVNSLVQIVTLYSVLFDSERTYHLTCDWKDAQTVSLWRSLIPVFLGTETYLLGLTIDRTIGFSLGEVGVAASFNYAGLLYGLLNTLVAMPIITVFYTELSSNYTNNGLDNLFSRLNDTISKIILLLFPLSVFLFVESYDFVTVVLKRGAFDERSVHLTSKIFMVYALTCPIYAIRSLFSRAYIVIGYTKVPMISGIIFITLNIILSIIGSKIWGVTGIVLGAFIAMTISTLYIVIHLKTKYGFKNPAIISILKIVAASLASALVVYFIVKTDIITSLPYLRLILSGILASLVYIGFLIVFRCQEMQSLIIQIIKKITT